MSCCSHSLPLLLIFPHLLSLRPWFPLFPSVCFLSASSFLSPLTSSLHDSLSLSPCTLRSPSLPCSLLLCPSISLVARVELHYKLSWQKLKGRCKNRCSEENPDTRSESFPTVMLSQSLFSLKCLCFLSDCVFFHHKQQQCVIERRIDKSTQRRHIKVTILIHFHEVLDTLHDHNFLSNSLSIYLHSACTSLHSRCLCYVAGSAIIVLVSNCLHTHKDLTGNNAASALLVNRSLSSHIIMMKSCRRQSPHRTHQLKILKGL